MRLVHRLAAWLDAWQLIGYGARFSDKAFLLWYCLLRIALLPLRLVSARLYQKAPFLLGLVPTVTIAAPYGTFRARSRSSDLLHLLPHYERAVSATLARNAGNVFVDIGASIGRHSIAVARKNSACRVLALEPSQETFAALTKNIALNGLANITPLRVACAARNQKLALHSAGRIAHGTASVDKYQAERHGWKARKAEHVTALTLDSALAAQRIPVAQVSAVKIDVEGAELRVLHGAKRLLAEGNASVVAESHDAATRNDCIDILRLHGYAILPIDANHFIAEKTARRT